MRALIEKDLKSTKNVLLTVILMFIVAWGLMIYFHISSGFRDANFLIFPFIGSAFITFNLVAHMCNAEEINGVKARLVQLPVKPSMIVFSKYVSSLIILSSVIVLNALLTFVFYKTSVIRGPSDVAIESLGVIVNITVLSIAVYLPFYFAKSIRHAAWAMRIAFIAWAVLLMAVPQLLFNQFYDGVNVPINFSEKLSTNLLISSIFLLLVSLFISLWINQLSRMRKVVTMPLVLVPVCMSIIFSFSISSTVSETITEVQDELSRLHIESIDYLTYETPSEKHQLLIRVDVKPIINDYHVKSNTWITMTLPEETERYTQSTRVTFSLRARDSVEWSVYEPELHSQMFEMEFPQLLTNSEVKEVQGMLERGKIEFEVTSPFLGNDSFRLSKEGM
ncbi:ABC-2 transporter permease [Bacillus shivajii]|uniref:ABC-2 transporter permease n=1 Tax=Bacillus shivajii TaxID=1983719 RepID=UPI001CF9D489|nr:ABC-2 transporter permease [Bacillus shivajii]UCZ54397.1 ABC-2 transporter permease [Bacillus shivajii]